MTDQKHTKEPWQVDEAFCPEHKTYNVAIYHSPSEVEIIEVVEGGCHCKDSPVTKENAKRIVECVNACAGIENPLDLRRERDELREALEELLLAEKLDDDDPILDKARCMAGNILAKTKESI